MTQQPNPFQHDVRLRGRSMGASEAEHTSFLAKLADVAENLEKLEMEQPALAPREREQPRPPLSAAGSPLPPPPPGLITPNPTTLNPFGRPQPTSTFSQPVAIAPLEARHPHGYPQHGYGSSARQAPPQPAYPHQPPPQPLQNPFAPPSYVDPGYRGAQPGYPPPGYGQPQYPPQPAYPHQPPPQQYGGYAQQPPPRDYGYQQPAPGYPQHPYPPQAPMPQAPPPRPLENPFAPSHAAPQHNPYAAPQPAPTPARPLENPFAPSRPAPTPYQAPQHVAPVHAPPQAAPYAAPQAPPAVVAPAPEPSPLYNPAPSYPGMPAAAADAEPDDGGEQT